MVSCLASGETDEMLMRFIAAALKEVIKGKLQA